MAITKIKCLRIIGVMDKLYEAAEVIGKSKSFQPDDPYNFYSDNKKFLPVLQENPYAGVTDKFTSVLDSAVIKRKSVDIGEKEFSIEEISDFADKINEMLDTKYSLELKIDECKRNIEQMKHFVDLDFDIRKINECRYVRANFGKLPKQSFENLKAYNDNPFVVFFPCSNDDEYYWGLYMSPVSNSDDVDRIFSGLYFESCGILEMDGTPESYCKEQKELLPKLTEQLNAANKEFAGFVKENNTLINQYYSFLEKYRQNYDIIGKAISYSRSFILVGWVSADCAEAVSEELEKIDSVECTLSDGKEEIKHSPPVKLKNNPFSKGFEFYTEMYGLPNYQEFDPTTFIAVTYTVLFGIMFGDVGHGLMVLLAGIFMKKKLKMPIGSVLIPCGISGTIFGFVYGSVFGYEEVLGPMYRALFGLEEKPISVMAPATTNTIIYLAVGIGMLLVTLAIILGIIVSFKTGDLENAIFGSNGICGLVFYVAVVAAIVCQMMLGIKLANPVYVVVLIVLPILLIYLKEPLGRLVSGKSNWQPESWGGYCVQNFFELFEVCLSYVTNTMSFLRVGAFVLVHAGMMEVVFTLANMSNGFGYIAIVVIGNIFVMALEALLVCIQVLRLEFYEMFGRFYRGDGRAFKPVSSLAE